MLVASKRPESTPCGTIICGCEDRKCYELYVDTVGSGPGKRDVILYSKTSHTGGLSQFSARVGSETFVLVSKDQGTRDVEGVGERKEEYASGGAVAVLGLFRFYEWGGSWEHTSNA